MGWGWTMITVGDDEWPFQMEYLEVIGWKKAYELLVVGWKFPEGVLEGARGGLIPRWYSLYQ